MLLEVHPDELRAEIGHTGNEIWWPSAEKPIHRIRSFHIQEIVDCFLRRGKALVLIEYFPRMAPVGMDADWQLMDTETKLEVRFQQYLNKYSGIFVGEKPNGGHAVVWNHLESKIYDPTPPKGYVYSIENNPLGFRAREFWAMISCQ